jgi:hypothetical protein
MTWYAWTIIATLVLGAGIQIATIGRPREPLTPGVVLVTTVLNGLIVWGIITLATRGQ